MYVGDEQGVEPFVETSTRIIDLQGMLLPGFNDSHVHIVQGGLGPGRAGALLVGGSDWSVTSMNPLAAIQVAVTRRGPRAAAGPAWFPEEVVTLDIMLVAYTINGARLQFQEDWVGSITIGKALTWSCWIAIWPRYPLRRCITRKYATRSSRADKSTRS